MKKVFVGGGEFNWEKSVGEGKFRVDEKSFI